MRGAQSSSGQASSRSTQRLQLGAGLHRAGPSRAPVARAVMQAEALVLQQTSRQALAAKQPTLQYRFIVPEYVTRFGESLKVVGSLPELGSWDLNAAPGMTWHEGHRWVFESRLPKSTFEFKVVALLGHEVRWEQGVNRVVQAEDEGVDVPVEVVINLTCSFGHTDDTGMELVLNRNSIQESYELAAATLELLRKRRMRLERTLQEAAASDGLSAVETRRFEVARLEAAVSSQAQSVEDLGVLVSGARLSEDGQSLLLKLSDGKVHVPKQIGSLSQVHSASTIGLALAAGDVGNGSGNGAAQARSSSSRAAIPAGALSSSDSDMEIEPDDAAAAMAAAAFASLNYRRPSYNNKARSKAARRLADHAAAAAPTPTGSRAPPEAIPASPVAAAAAPKATPASAEPPSPAAAVAATFAAQQTAAPIAAPVAPETVAPAAAAAAASEGFAVDGGDSSPAQVASQAPAVAQQESQHQHQQQQQAQEQKRAAPSATSLFFGVDLSSLPPPQVGVDGALFFSAELLSAFELPKARPASAGANGAASHQAPAPMSDADIARRLADLSESLERTLERMSRTSDAQQPAGAWREVEAQLQEAQALQEQLMASRGGLTAAQQEELGQLQELVRLATGTLSNRQSVTMTLSMGTPPEAHREGNGAAQVEQPVAVTV